MTGDRSSADIMAERSVTLITELSDELAEVTSTLLSEIERDRNLLGGIVKRDRQIKALKKRIQQLESELSSRTDPVATVAGASNSNFVKDASVEDDSSAGAGDLLNQEETIRVSGWRSLLPSHLRGTDVDPRLLKAKKLYWRIRKSLSRVRTDG